MPRRIICILAITIVLLFAHTTALSQDSACVPLTFYPTKLGSNEVQQAFTAMVNNFILYSSLLEEVDSASGYLISRNAADKEEAIDYLSAGFNPRLAADIVEAYTQCIPNTKKLAIIPCDGIPVLKQADYNECEYCQLNRDNIIFRRSYSCCYSQEDLYLFVIYLQYDIEEYWRIDKLELVEITV